MDVYTALLFAFLFNCVTSHNINEYIDYWCKYNNGDLVKNVIDLPILKIGHGFIKYSLENGKLGDLRTLKRTGDCYVEPSNGTAAVRIEIGLDNLYLDFSKCFIVTPIYSKEARLNVTSSDNSVSLDITIDYKNSKKCSLELNGCNVERLEITRVQVEGFGIFNPLIGWLSKKILSSNKEELNRAVNKYLQREMKEIFEKYNTCNRIKEILETSGTK